MERIALHQHRGAGRGLGSRTRTTVVLTVAIITTLAVLVVPAAATHTVVYHHGYLQPNVWEPTDGYDARSGNMIQAPGQCLTMGERFGILYTNTDNQVLSRYFSVPGKCYSFFTYEYRPYARAWCMIEMQPGWGYFSRWTKCTASP